MPSPTRASLRLFRLLMVLLVAPPLLPADAPAPALPADNPYAPAYAALARLTPADKDALSAGKPASPAAAPILAEINRSLAAGRQAPSVDWGVDYEHANFTTAIPGVAESNLINKISLSRMENATPTTIVDRTLETLALARHVGRDGPLISLLVERASETRAEAWLDKNLSRLSPQDARRLVAGIEALPSGGDLPTALAVEKMLFVDRQIDEIRQLVAKLEETDPAPGSFASKLRLTGILVEGPLTSVGLEQTDASFWLKPGENKHGITLLSVNLARDEALLACDGRLARVRLSSKKITTIDFSRLAQAITTLPKDGFLRTILESEDPATCEAVIRGFERAAREIGDLYAEAAAHPENFADTPAYRERFQKLGLIVQNTAEMLPRMIANENKARERQSKLLADLSAIATQTRP